MGLSSAQMLSRPLLASPHEAALDLFVRAATWRSAMELAHELWSHRWREDGATDAGGAAGLDEGAVVGAGGRVDAQGSVSSLDAVRDVGANRSYQDAELLEAVAALVAETQDALVERKGLVGVELGAGQKRDLAGQVKKAAAAEVEVALGFSPLEAGQVVAVATCAADLLEVFLGALRRGAASWAMVRHFWASSHRLTGPQRLLCALALFGDEVGLAHESRLDPEGELLDRPWPQSGFRAACEQEIAAAEGTDPEGERARRRRAYDRRRVSVKVHDDGTATLINTGPAATILAGLARLDKAARALRRAGDERTLDQLRSDLDSANRIYSRLRLPESIDPPRAEAAAGRSGQDQHGQDQHGQHRQEPAQEATGRQKQASLDDQAKPGELGEPGAELTLFERAIAPDDMEMLARVINAQPPVSLQVIVPHSALMVGAPVCGECATSITGESSASAVRGAGPPSAPATQTQTQAHTQAQPESLHPPSLHPPTLHSPPDSPGRGQVAEILGPHPMSITPGHARELALVPGTELFRLMTDAADGRLVERTIDGYRPDTDMRRQVIAADVYSRAPGRRVGAHAGELDHVTPYGWGGGATNELNLALLAKTPHDLKTQGLWEAIIGPLRDLTFTTLLGQVARTRTHDYRQYTRDLDPEDIDEIRDRANRAAYAALAADPAQRYRPRPGPDGRRITLTHTTKSGETRHGPPPDMSS
ncbi:hypothetical protein [Ornithinimicrobium panacihumi]|uniref:hypothetical protein n=1 Tax=Ornithinimicrobium panacihumi TaxID=2008449 RepID=UPI003F8CBCE8